MKRGVAAGILGLCLIATGWLLLRGLRPEPLPIGAALSGITYRSADGAHPLRFAPDGRTAVVLFHPACATCEAELSVLDASLSSFDAADVFLLTPADSIPQTFKARWPALAESKRVHWGTIDIETFRDRFGERVVPSVLLFDEEGRLVTRMRGAVGPDTPITGSPSWTAPKSQSRSRRAALRALS